MDCKKQNASLEQNCRQKLAVTNDPVEKFKLQALKKGAAGIKTIGRKFRLMDDSGDRRLSWDEFKVGCYEVLRGIRGMSEEELRIVFNTFDRDGTGALDYEEFLAGIRPRMNDVRTQLVKKAFIKMDKTGDGVVTVDDLVGTYNPKFHPKYQNGEYTRKEVFEEFLKNFEAEDNADGQVTFDEWLDYYSGVSASIDDDAYFSLMMYNCWGVKAVD